MGDPRISEAHGEVVILHRGIAAPRDWRTVSSYPPKDWPADEQAARDAFAHRFDGPARNLDATPIGERLVRFFRRNGDRFIFGLSCFAAGSLFTCAAAYCIRLAVLS